MLTTPGPYEAIVLADSIADGCRLTTLCATFPRFVLAEFNTHRMFSRNSASSRAIPVKKRVQQIRANPVTPLSFGKNKRGMQASCEEVADQGAAFDKWLAAAMEACDRAEGLADLELHKQWANRLCETFAWHTVIVTATEWANYDALRISPGAQPEICKVSEAMLSAREASTPTEIEPGGWHLPLAALAEVTEYAKELAVEYAKAGLLEKLAVRLSVSRCAAISFERHLDHDIDKDLERYDKLADFGHMSPFEHAAQAGAARRGSWAPMYPPPFSPRYALRSHGRGERGEKRGADGLFPHGAWVVDGYFCGNLRAPWIQHRKQLLGEFVFQGD